MLDISTIGSGGGSLVSVIGNGAMQVGPKSAGSFPGPVCYGRGGTTPTVTDALVCLGHLNPTTALGGAVPIDAAGARAAIDQHVASPLSMEVERAAHGVLALTSHDMATGIRQITLERGYDLREFALVAYRGARPTVACYVMRELILPAVVVPGEPGTFSSAGMLWADVVTESFRSQVMPLAPGSLERLFAVLTAVEQHATQALVGQVFDVDDVATESFVGLRYEKESYEMLIGIGGESDSFELRVLRQEFDAEHERVYGHSAGDQKVEIVGCRARASVRLASLEDDDTRDASISPSSSEAAQIRRTALFQLGDGALAQVETPVYWRDELPRGFHAAGPLVVEERGSTTVVLHRQSVTVDPFLNMVVTEDE